MAIQDGHVYSLRVYALGVGRVSRQARVNSRAHLATPTVLCDARSGHPSGRTLRKTDGKEGVRVLGKVLVLGMDLVLGKRGNGSLCEAWTTGKVSDII